MDCLKAQLVPCRLALVILVCSRRQSAHPMRCLPWPATTPLTMPDTSSLPVARVVSAEWMDGFHTNVSGTLARKNSVHQVINAISAFALSVHFSKIGNGVTSTAVNSGQNLLQRTHQLLLSSCATLVPKSTFFEVAQAGKDRRDGARSTRSSLAPAASRVLPTVGDE